jgi:hypothetical protein
MTLSSSVPHSLMTISPIGSTYDAKRSMSQLDPIVVMMKDQFGNYVLQQMIDAADDHQRKRLLARIRPHATLLR